MQKKISTKKLVISVLIIFFMISGTGFMLYKNKSLTSRKTTAVNAPTMLNNPAPAVSGAKPGQAIGTDGANNQAAGENQIIGINKINQDRTLNLSIFSSDKFKTLEAGAPVTKEQPEVGKRNPFKPD